MRLAFTSAALIAATAPSWPAAGQTAREKAKAIYDEGVAAFKAGRFEEALGHFERAYLLDPSPILLYNQARAHEELGNAEQAIEYFRLYLDRVPDAPDRAEVERRVRVMEAILERRRAEAAPAPPEAAVADEPGDGLTLRPFAYTALGLGAAGLAAGFWFTLEMNAAEDEYDEALRDRRPRAALDAEDRAGSAATAATIAFIAGGALAGTGVALWLLDDDDAAAVAAAPTPGGALLTWSARF